MTYEEQFLALLDKLLTKGEWIENERTGKRCLTLFGETLEYTLEDPPLLTTKQSFPVSAVAELLGYLRGYGNAQQFEDVGSKTWWANSDDNESWLNNPHRKGSGDIGRAYGVVARDFNGIDTIKNVFEDLANGVDNRGEIITFWKPDEFYKAALRPCMHTHCFNIIGDTINLHSIQRSQDKMLGGNFNSIQCYFLLLIASRISGKKFGRVKHDITNLHIYEDHIEGVKQMLSRTPLKNNSILKLVDWVTSFDDVIGNDKHAREYVVVDNYKHLGKIHFDMAV